jgi:tRNA nucleotidyltransferase/poly(A) polymerase
MNTIFKLFQEFASRNGIENTSFLVGGTVRDLLSDMAIHDYDIVIKHNTVDMARAFADQTGASFVVLDKDFGIIRVAKDREFIDICTMKGKSIEDDLSQRDFTINAMALNLGVCKGLTSTGSISLAPYVIDPFDGTQDLKFNLIRMVSENNLFNDPLRLLRAYRFASVLGFSIHIDTSKAIRKYAPHISSVSVERIAEELRHILKVKFSCKTVYDMQNSGLLLGIFPELRDISYEQLLHSVQSCSCVENILNKLPLYFSSHEEYFAGYFKEAHRVICLKLAVLLREGNLSEKAAIRLKMSNKEIEFIRMIIEQHRRLVMLKDADKTLKIDYLIESGDDIYPLLIFGLAVDITSQPDVTSTLQLCNDLLNIYHCEIMPKKKYLPILKGDDLIEKFHLQPSPLFSKMLGGIERLFLHGLINSKDEALNAVAEMLKKEQENQ